MNRTPCYWVALAAALAVAVLAQASSATQWGHHGGGLRAALADDPECAGQSELSCDGCVGQVKCFKAGQFWFLEEKRNCSGATPYCDATNGTCTADASKALNCADAQPVTTFQCPGAGYWPDLASCTKYYICTAALSAYAMDCSAYASTVYDHKTASCVPRAGASCFALTCPSAGSLVAYTPDPSIYAACRDKTASRAAIITCPKGQTFSAAAKACQVACTAAGRTAVASDAKAYTECVDLGGGKLSAPTPGRCPGSTVFKEDQGRCAEP